MDDLLAIMSKSQKTEQDEIGLYRYGSCEERAAD